MLYDIFDKNKLHQCPIGSFDTEVCTCSSCCEARKWRESNQALQAAIMKNFAPTGSLMPANAFVQKDNKPKESSKEKYERQRRERIKEYQQVDFPSVEEVLKNPELDAIKPVNIDPASSLADDFSELLSEGKEFLANPSISGLASMAVIAIPGKMAEFGSSLTKDYKRTFFDVHPELEGKVIVHHAVEQQVQRRYPGLVSDSEMHSLENLRGIPKAKNNDLHLSKIRKEWNRFYKANPNPSKEDLLKKATEIDLKLGGEFDPPIGD